MTEMSAEKGRGDAGFGVSLHRSRHRDYGPGNGIADAVGRNTGAGRAAEVSESRRRDEIWSWARNKQPSTINITTTTSSKSD